jgi:2'-5' RNA ligase
MIEENSKGNYEFSSVQFNYPIDFAKDVMQWGRKNVDTEDIFVDPHDESYGLEDNIHTTVLYGIHDKTPSKTKRIIEPTPPFKITLGEIDKFPGGTDYDVIKINVEGDVLRDLHYKIRENITNTNSYPDYKPHMTIGYVLPNSCNHLLGSEEFKGMTFQVNTVIFSSSEKKWKKFKIKLEG